MAASDIGEAPPTEVSILMTTDGGEGEEGEVLELL